MYNLKIKVCGVTREKDAKLAIKYGADMLGFIFYNKSERYVSITQVKKIINLIPPTIFKVGVFVNEDIKQILSIANKLSLDFIQLSGDETQKDISTLQKSGFKVIKTISVAIQNNILKASKLKTDIVHLDTADTKLYGGSGRQFNWNLKLPKNMKNIMLAGGINAGNVLDGIKNFKPLIIDVNSGVEYKPGFKSDKLLKEFFQKVNKFRYGK